MRVSRVCPCTAVSDLFFFGLSLLQKEYININIYVARNGSKKKIALHLHFIIQITEVSAWK